MAYVAGTKPPTGASACFLLYKGLSPRPTIAPNLIIKRRPNVVVMLNRVPYNNGHLLIAPNAHKARLQDLSAPEHAEIQQTIGELLDVYDKLLMADGYNVGLNLGKAAGAGLPGHLHWHLVPRFGMGTLNFMPVLTDTRVIVQSLDSLYELLTKAWQ